MADVQDGATIIFSRTKALYKSFLSILFRLCNFARSEIVAESQFEVDEIFLIDFQWKAWEYRVIKYCTMLILMELRFCI